MGQFGGLRSRLRQYLGSERGDIVTGWLTQIVLIVAVIATIAHEALAPLIGSLALEDPAKRTLRAAIAAVERGDRDDEILEAAQIQADRDNVEIVELTVSDDDPPEVTVVITREPQTWLIHRWSVTEEYAQPTQSATDTVGD